MKIIIIGKQFETSNTQPPLRWGYVTPLSKPSKEAKP